VKKKLEETMRLDPSQVSAIKSTVQDMLGPESRVWLFGSRVDDRKKGGDIDLYIETEKPCTLKDKLRVTTRLQLAIGFRKIDVLLHVHGSPQKSIYDTAKNEGVLL